MSEPTTRVLPSGRIEVDLRIWNGPRTSRATPEEAKDLISEYRKARKKDGEWWTMMRPAERDRIRTTVTSIKAAGLEIDTVWADHQRWSKENDTAVATPMPYIDVVTSHHDAQILHGIGKRYASEIKGIFLRFGAGREQQPIHKILPRELQRFLDTSRDPRTGKLWSTSTKCTQKGRFAGLWTHAIQNGWAIKNITEQLATLRRDPYDVHVYPNEITMNLLAGILHYDPARERIIGSTALALFGAMRPEEIESKKALRNNIKGEPPFGWDCINLNDAGTVNKNAPYAGTCRLEKWMTKTIDKRVIRLQQTCVDWLILAKEYDNPLPPVNERRLIDAVCELIGLDEWEKDWMRHNCGTHLNAIYKDDWDTVKDLGNSQKVFLEHYKDLHVNEAVSLDHWAITPERVKAYMKTQAWKDVLSAAAAKRERSASESAKPGN